MQEALKPIGAAKEVSLADFKKVMAGLTNTTPTNEILNAFKVFDKAADGSVNKDEIASALCSMGDKLTNDQVINDTHSPISRSRPMLGVVARREEQLGMMASS